MKAIQYLPKLIFFTVLLTGCSAITGEEIARIPVNEASSENNVVIKDVTLDLKKGDEIILWSDMDMEYEGDVQLRFRIQILKDGKEHGGLEIDPTEKNVTMGELKTTFSNKTSWSFTGRNRKISVDADGTYTFKALLATSENPTLKIKKAEIIIKK